MHIVKRLARRVSAYSLYACIASTLPSVGVSMEYYLPEQPSAPISATLPLGDVSIPSSYHQYQSQKVTQGDILLPSASPNAKSAVFDQRSLWQSGVVPYVVAEGVSEGLLARLESAMEHWHNSTGLRFEAHSNTNNLTAFVAVYGADICASNVGKVGTVNYLLLSEFCSTGSIIHELGHTAGLLHEHMRGDRDAYIQINTDNIRPQALHNFTEVAPIGFRNYGDYDYDSIMHYTETAFSSNGLPTITARQAGVTFGQRDHLSALDSATINLMYGTDIIVSAELIDNSSAPPSVVITVENNGPFGANDIEVSIEGSSSIAAPRFNSTGCENRSHCVVTHLGVGQRIELKATLHSTDIGSDTLTITASTQVHDHHPSNNQSSLTFNATRVSLPPVQQDELASVAGGGSLGWLGMMGLAIAAFAKSLSSSRCKIGKSVCMAMLALWISGCDSVTTITMVGEPETSTALVSQDPIELDYWTQALPIKDADSIRLIKTKVRDRRGVHHNWEDVSDLIDAGASTLTLPAYAADEEFWGEVYRLEANFDGYLIGRVLYQTQNTAQSLPLQILPIHDLIYQSSRWTAQRSISQVEDEKVDQMVNLGSSLLKRIDSVWRTLTLGKPSGFTAFDSDDARLTDFSNPIALKRYAERVHRLQDRGPILTELLSMHSYVPETQIDDILQIGKQVIMSSKQACTWLIQRHQSGFFNISDQAPCLLGADLVVHNHNAIVMRVQSNELQLHTLSNERLTYADRLTLDADMIDVVAFDSGFAILGDDNALYHYRTDSGQFELVDRIEVNFGPTGLQSLNDQLVVYGVQNHVYRLSDNRLVHQKKLLTKGIVASGGVSGRDFMVLHDKTRLLMYQVQSDGLLAYAEHKDWTPIYFSPPRSDLNLDDIALIDDQLHGIFSWSFQTGDGTPSARHYYDTATLIRDDSGLHIDTAYTPVKIGDRKNNAKLRLAGTNLMMLHSDGPPISLGSNFIELLESAHKFNYLADIELFDTTPTDNHAVALAKVPGQVDAYLRDNLHIVEGHNRLYYYYSPIEDSAIYQVDQGIDWMGKVGEQYWLTSMTGRLIRLTHDRENHQFIETVSTQTHPIESAAMGEHFLAWNLYGKGILLSALDADTPSQATTALDIKNISAYQVHGDQIAVGGMGELAIWKIEDNLGPTLRYRSNTASVIDDIAWLDDDTIAYTDGALGVKIISIANNIAQPISKIETYSTVRQLSATEDYLALADESNTLLIYDIKDRSHPQNIGVLALVPQVKHIEFNRVPVPGTDLVNQYLQLSLAGSTLYQLFVPQLQLSCDSLPSVTDNRKRCLAE